MKVFAPPAGTGNPQQARLGQPAIPLAAPPVCLEHAEVVSADLGRLHGGATPPQRAMIKDFQPLSRRDRPGGRTRPDLAANWGEHFGPAREKAPRRDCRAALRRLKSRGGGISAPPAFPPAFRQAVGTHQRKAIGSAMAKEAVASVSFGDRMLGSIRLRSRPRKSPRAARSADSPAASLTLDERPAGEEKSGDTVRRTGPHGGELRGFLLAAAGGDRGLGAGVRPRR